MDFPDYKYTHVSPLARRLFTVRKRLDSFQIEGVTRVFFGSNFISVGIENTERWGEVKPEVYEAITDQFSKQAPLFTDEPEREDTKIHEDDSEAVQLIKKILETNIRPFVNEDGGDIEFQGFDEEEGIVRLAMKGSCAGCPSSSITLKNGIEKMLMYYVEEVKTVEAVDFE